MTVPRPFLTARWSNLCIVTYAVPRRVLEPLLPPGLILDERDGKCFASLVAFDFLDTRVLGMRIPMHVNFPEVNLRFYVREGTRRGVCFIREFVPRRAISWAARLIYNEPYASARMDSRVDVGSDRLSVAHRFERGGAVGSMTVVGRGPATVPAADSVEHFFKEHTWGFGSDRRGGLLRYRVVHPVWAVYQVESCSLGVDWAGLYGTQWSLLADTQPEYVVLAAGSRVEVYPKGTELAIDADTHPLGSS